MCGSGMGQVDISRVPYASRRMRIEKITGTDIPVLSLPNAAVAYSQKFSTGGALISGFPSYPHNHLLIYLIHYVIKYFSEK